MMRGLLSKSFREVWLATLLFSLGLFAVLALLTFILPQIQGSIGAVFSKLPFVKGLLSALLGTQLGDQINAQTMQAFLWVHPVVLALVWAYEIMICTRLPAGEIDRGTIDILFSLPVSRWKVYLAETIVWLAGGIVLLVMALLGHLYLASEMPSATRPPVSQVFVILSNFYCVYLAVGGMTFLISSCSSYRGRAVGTIFGIVLASFLLNFLAQFWEPAKQAASLSVMTYYRPAQVLLKGGMPYGDMTVLLLIAFLAWGLGGIIFSRRNLCTV